ncbi:hypothetical protein BKI52_08280 [marine bacterium AO1-C]|nr:hypothetical protein BKI52_08280 [marine bacterium AO1-C]
MSARIIVHLENPSGEHISEAEAHNITRLLQSDNEANQKLGLTFLENMLERFPAGKYPLVLPQAWLEQVFEWLLKMNVHTLEVCDQPYLWPLPAAFKQMVQLKGLVLRKMKITALPEEIYQFKSLEILDIADNYWESEDRYYPDEHRPLLDKRLTDFTNLRKLDISGNKYYDKELPDNLKQLTRLEYIGLSGNRLQKIPDFVFHCPALKVLEIADSWIFSSDRGTIFRQLKKLANLKHLEKIDVSVNYSGISRIPPEWKQLTKLKYLRINNNEISELPSTLGDWPSLQYIYLENNGLKTLPDNFGNLRLVDDVLDLSNNKLKALPASICQLTHLKKLKLEHNKLKNLPKEFGELINLEELQLAYNQLKSLPESFENLTKLKGKLDLSQNKLTKFPLPMCKLAKITELELASNQITEIPAEIRTMKQLLFLRVDYNKLERIHESIGELNSLEALFLAYNKLKELPESITSLPMRYLTLVGNQLEKLPDNFGNFTNLSSRLDLSYNQLKELPESFAQLSQIQELNLSKNQLTYLPDFWDRLIRIYDLNISKNQLKALPDSIGHMQSLVDLSLEENELRRLPQTMQHLKHLKLLIIRNNPLEERIPEMPHCKQLKVLMNTIQR